MSSTEPVFLDTPMFAAGEGMVAPATVLLVAARGSGMAGKTE